MPIPLSSGRSERLAQKTIDTHAAWRGAPNVLLIAPPPIHPDYAKTAVAGEMGDKCVERSRGLAKEFKDVADRLHCHFLDAGSIPGIEMYPLRLDALEPGKSQTSGRRADKSNERDTLGILLEYKKPVGVLPTGFCHGFKTLLSVSSAAVPGV